MITEFDRQTYRDHAAAILPIIARERAAALSAATPRIEAVVREACAAVADEHDDPPQSDHGQGWRDASRSIAAAIREMKP